MTVNIKRLTKQTKQGTYALNYSFRFHIVTRESKRKSAKFIDDKKHVRSFTLHRAFEIYADSFPWTHRFYQIVCWFDEKLRF